MRTSILILLLVLLLALSSSRLDSLSAAVIPQSVDMPVANSSQPRASAKPVAESQDATVPRWVAITAARESWQQVVKLQGDALARLEYCRTQVLGGESLWCARQVAEDCHRTQGQGAKKVADMERAIQERTGEPVEIDLRSHLAYCRRLWLADPAVVGTREERWVELLEKAHPVAVADQLTGYNRAGLHVINSSGADLLRNAWLSGDADAIHHLLVRCIPEDAPAAEGGSLSLALIACRLRGNCAEMPPEQLEWCKTAELQGFCPSASAHYEEWMSRHASMDDYRQAAAFSDQMMEFLGAGDPSWPVLEKCLAKGRFGETP
ncbi:MAG: hypothetical protein V4709_14440 [Pseudomonadota bacterium]